MSKYDVENVGDCKMCGSADHYLEFIREQSTCNGDGDYRVVSEERMQVICSDCRYRWYAKLNEEV